MRPILRSNPRASYKHDDSLVTKALSKLAAKSAARRLLAFDQNWLSKGSGYLAPSLAEELAIVKRGRDQLLCYRFNTMRKEHASLPNLMLIHLPCVSETMIL